MKAVILAGGKGTRMMPLTATKTKPMIPFLNKPVMEHIVEKLVDEGFDEIIITTNYKVEQIADYFGDGSPWGARIRVVNEDHPLGTAGSVKNAVHHLDDTFVVIQGDNISEIDIRGLVDEHKRMGADATISLMEVEETHLFGIAEMDGDDIIRFKEKPKRSETFSNLANDGIYVLEPGVLDMIPLKFYDFSKDLFPRMLEEGKRLCGSVTHAFWRDVGTPNDYLSATHHMLHGESLIGLNCKLSEAKINESVLGDDCTIDCASIRSSVLFDNVCVGRGSTLKHCIVGSCCRVGKGVDVWPGAVIGDNVKIGDSCVIKSGARIGPNVVIADSETISGVVEE